LAWESGKSQIMKFILMIILIFGIIAFMLVSFLFIQYQNIETYLIMNIAVDAILILLMIFVINWRVWRHLSGATFYALEIYSPDGSVSTELYRRKSYFEIDLDKMEHHMDSRQVKILHENEAAIADLKDTVAKMVHKQKEIEDAAMKKAAKEAEKERKEREKAAKAEEKARAKAAEEVPPAEEQVAPGSEDTSKSAVESNE